VFSKMLCLIIAVGAFVALFAAQRDFPPQCGFVCTRNAAFTIFIDGVNSRVSCSDQNGDLTARCNSCCQSYAMFNQLPSENAAGFPSSDGNSCVCCVNNNR
ncbi:hypothetical protein PMAYCL1PPCAC_10908, partial [Pristionchus mayeri]